jgi:hypothetical protein
MAYWNGAQWFDVGSGADDSVRVMDVSDDGFILAGGDFTRIGSADADYLGFWNGSTWVNLDTSISASVYAAMFDRYGNIYAGAGVLSGFSARTTIKNIGTAEVAPIVYFVGPGTLRWIENQTSHKRVYLDMEILENEEIMFDFSNGKIESTVRGNLLYAVLPGSDIRAFTLFPGDNVIAAMVVEDIGATMHMYYVPRHWSADATQRGDSL